MKIVDLILVLEVLEYILENDLLIFLEKIKVVINVMFVCIIFNFEYWDEILKFLLEVKECRYILDYFFYYKLKFINLYYYKIVMILEKMFNLLF